VSLTTFWHRRTEAIIWSRIYTHSLSQAPYRLCKCKV